MFTLKEISEVKVWEEFNSNHMYGCFLQSWDWGEFQKSLGNRVERLGFFRGKTLVGICMVVLEEDKLGTIAYTSRGPIMDWGNTEKLNAVLSLLKERYIGGTCIVLRVDPVVLEIDDERKNVFSEGGFKPGIRTMQVEDAWMLNIGGKNDEELFAWMKESGMRKKVPNYIRGSVKKGVKVYEANTLEDVRIFTAMISDMGTGIGLNLGSAEYFKKIWEMNNGAVKIYIGKLNNVPVVSALVASYGNEAAYLYGASTPEIGNSNAAYLMQWEIMKAARNDGVQRYNMWGVVTGDDYQPGKPAYGYSYFKRSFGGYIEKYMRVQEFPYSKIKYSLFRLREKKRMKAAKKLGVM